MMKGYCPNSGCSFHKITFEVAEGQRCLWCTSPLRDLTAEITDMLGNLRTRGGGLW